MPQDYLGECGEQRQNAPSMARLVSFLERMRVGVTRMQLWPHLVRFPV